MGVYRVTIHLKLPSANDYIKACRTNRYVGAKLKSETEDDIMLFLSVLPRFERPVKIHFHWIEGNKRRDLDGIAFGKKFILDALVKAHKLIDDSSKYVVGFTDTFEYSKDTKVILYIEEV